MNARDKERKRGKQVTKEAIRTTVTIRVARMLARIVRAIRIYRAGDLVHKGREIKAWLNGQGRIMNPGGWMTLHNGHRGRSLPNMGIGGVRRSSNDNLRNKEIKS